MSDTLELLRCGGCEAPIPLVDAEAVSCAFCEARVPIPEDHREAQRTALEGQAARAQAAERLEALGKRPQDSILWLGVLAILTLPSLAVFLASRSADLGLSELELLVFAGFPASFPGAGLYLWAVISSGTGQRFCAALGAAPRATAKGPLGCRNCAAPLSEPEVGHVTRCPYCGSDNLLRSFELAGLQEHLRGSLRTLEQAVRLMRLRRAQWALGILLGGVLFAGLVVLVVLAQR